LNPVFLTALEGSKWGINCVKGLLILGKVLSYEPPILTGALMIWLDGWGLGP